MSPKNSKVSMVTDTDTVRTRVFAVGERYVGKATIALKDQTDKDIFFDFLEYEISYGDLWFEADWFSAIGYTAGEWLFKITKISENDTGSSSEIKFTYIMRPVQQDEDTIDLTEDEWPISGPECPAILEYVVDDTVQIEQDGDDIVIDDTGSDVSISATEMVFPWGSGTATDDFSAVPVTGDPQWVHITEEVYAVGVNICNAVYGVQPDDTIVYGITESTPGANASKENVDVSKSYVVNETFSADELDNIDASVLEFEFACKQLILNEAGPSIDMKIQFVNIINQVVSEYNLPTYSTNDDSSWNEARVSGYFPPNTRGVRIEITFNRGVATTVDKYAFVDNLLFAYRTIT